METWFRLFRLLIMVYRVIPVNIPEKKEYAEAETFRKMKALSHIFPCVSIRSLVWKSRRKCGHRDLTSTGMGVQLPLKLK